MEEKKGFRIHSFVLFIIIVATGSYLAYIQMNGSQNLWLKLGLLLVFVVSLYLGSKNWVQDNPNKNEKNWSDPDKQED